MYIFCKTLHVCVNININVCVKNRHPEEVTRILVTQIGPGSQNNIIGAMIHKTDVCNSVLHYVKSILWVKKMEVGSMQRR